jgi:hypothetical protein
MHAGNDLVDDLTANVEAAAKMAAEIDRALEGREEVERLLQPSAFSAQPSAGLTAEG